jgi:AbiV family abortive infection protein
MINDDTFLTQIEQILSGTSNFSINTSHQFDKCVDHILQLITDSRTMYISNAFSSSVFLSIAVIEEVGKVHMGMYISPSTTYVKKDKLRDHKSKEIAGASYTICMGERIERAVSPEELTKLFELVYSGDLKDLREQSIYCEKKDDDIVTPKDIISQEFSKNILLFAIESFDDNLVGYTPHSMEVSEKTDSLFDEISKL